MLFMGHSVTAGKTRSSLSKNDRQSISDVQELVRSLRQVLTNEGNWVPETIDAVLGGEADLKHESGEDLFTGAFKVLRSADEGGETLYRNLLRRLFHTNAPTSLHLVNLKGAAGEIGLRAGAADDFFGVINIGSDASFIKLTEQRLEGIVIEESSFGGSLFKTVNRQRSSINVLIGSKKFIEGWSSWRVSSMGLMNIGRGEGPQIIQLFGRGVRLLGKNRSLKRSTALPEEGPHPGWLPLLETLNIFGVRAKYMAQFRDYLAAEGIAADGCASKRTSMPHETRLRPASVDEIRSAHAASFEDEVALRLTIVDGLRPEVDLQPQMEAIVSNGVARETPAAHDAPASQKLPRHLLPLLSWDRLYRSLWQFRQQRGYRNLAFDRKILRRLIAEEHHRLRCRREILRCNCYGDLRRIENLAGMILRKYISLFHTREKRSWERRHLPSPPDEAGMATRE